MVKWGQNCFFGKNSLCKVRQGWGHPQLASGIAIAPETLTLITTF